jgi:hypothetical protein
MGRRPFPSLALRRPVTSNGSFPAWRTHIFGVQPRVAWELPALKPNLGSSVSIPVLPCRKGGDRAIEFVKDPTNYSSIARKVRKNLLLPPFEFAGGVHHFHGTGRALRELPGR